MWRPLRSYCPVRCRYSIVPDEYCKLEILFFSFVMLYLFLCISDVPYSPSNDQFSYRFFRGMLDPNEILLVWVKKFCYVTNLEFCMCCFVFICHSFLFFSNFLMNFLNVTLVENFKGSPRLFIYWDEACTWDYVVYRYKLE